LENKKRNAEEDIGNVSLGKKTVRTLFKNEKDHSGMVIGLEYVRNLYIITMFRLIKKSRMCRC
jgi:choline kinase